MGAAKLPPCFHKKIKKYFDPQKNQFFLTIVPNPLF